MDVEPPSYIFSNVTRLFQTAKSRAQGAELVSNRDNGRLGMD